MKKYISFFTLALLALTFSFSSCSDDDDNSGGNPEELSPDYKYSEQAVALLTVLDALAEVDSLPDNWNTSAFSVEATYGRALDAANPYVRSEAVSGAEEAIAIFNDLTGEEADASTQTKTWTCEGVGSLTYTLKNLSDCTATIDVNVPKLRGLTQIRLVPAEAIGENGSFKGTPYYTVGDVVIDGDDECWICARGAYSPAKKEDTHWFSFSLLSGENLYTVDYGEKTSYLPTKLGCEKEKMRYLVQFLKFVADPYDYASEEHDDDGNEILDTTVYPKGVGNLGLDYLSWEDLFDIADDWERNHYDEKCVVDQNANPKFSFEDFFDPDADVYIYYKGYSKLPFFSYKIYCMKYSGRACKEKSDNTSWSESSPQPFNIQDYLLGNGNPMGHERGLVVRYKTGKELNDKNSVKATEAISTVTEIYRYRAIYDE